MSDFSPAAGRIEKAYEQYRMVFAIAGLSAVVVGLFLLFWPAIITLVAAIAIGAYATAAGIFYLASGLFTSDMSTTGKVVRIVLGVALIALGIVALVNMNQTQGLIIIVLGVVVGLLWLTEGVLSLMVAIKQQNTNAWVIGFAVFAIAAGITSLFAPTFPAQFLRFLFGFSFLILGASQLVRAYQAGKVSKDVKKAVKDDKKALKKAGKMDAKAAVQDEIDSLEAASQATELEIELD